MIARLERAFRSLERMRRFRGHFFNWYDLHDLRVLEPAYISTVDSGNLAGHLIALRQALPRASRTRRARRAELRDAARRRSPSARDDYARGDGLPLPVRRRAQAVRHRLSAPTHTLDDSYYDLLASEARLASFVAIAKNDVPVEHWFRLGRTLTRAAGATALVSWSGSMFEYLMPALVMRSFPFTLLDQTYHGAVRAADRVRRGARRAVGRERERVQRCATGTTPISTAPSASPTSRSSAGSGSDLVVAPYATALALAGRARSARSRTSPRSRRRARSGRTASATRSTTRAPTRASGTRSCGNYMAHHVGMSLVALDQRAARRRLAAPLPCRSARARRRSCCCTSGFRAGSCCRTPQRAQPDEVAAGRRELERPAVREIDTPDTPQPHVALLGPAAVHDHGQPTRRRATAATRTSPSRAGAPTATTRRHRASSAT